jgi:TorA maturation chaperone TorD
MELLRELALNRSGVYAFLGQCFNAVPDKGFVETLRSEDFTECLRKISGLAEGEIKEGVELLEHFLKVNSSRDTEAFVQELAVDFIEAGLALNEEYGGPPDYIGTELKFLSLAGHCEADAWGKDQGEAVRLLGLQEGFVRRHALAWVPKFCEVMLEKAESEFYQHIAKITRGFLMLDAEQLREALVLAGEAESVFTRR